MTTTKPTPEEKVSKFGKQKTEEVEGVKYTLQFPGTLVVQEMLDYAKTQGSFKQTLYSEQIMEHVIASPQTDWDYWDKNDGYREVMDLADSFLGGLL
ncbi:hypothetical protein ACQKMD_01195 [Viridibacillus sp. NPDC096237]|uniref:hypothetical protein n=1 Tax=Viridibacillus sp. NPDC096237 TaxID=3390721 RepID=UPI003D05648B